MATRFYFDHRTVYPDFFRSDLTGWDVNAMVHPFPNLLTTTKPPASSDTLWSYPIPRTATTGWDDCAAVAYVSPPLQEQTLTGQAIAQIRALETGSTYNALSQMKVYLLDSTGAIKSMLYSGHTNLSMSWELGIALANRTFPYPPDPAVWADTDCEDGDRLLVVIGIRTSAASTNALVYAFSMGDISPTDLTDIPSVTDPHTPWVEFSMDLAFLSDTDADEPLPANTDYPILENRKPSRIGDPRALFGELGTGGGEVSPPPLEGQVWPRGNQ